MEGERKRDCIYPLAGWLSSSGADVHGISPLLWGKVYRAAALSRWSPPLFHNPYAGSGCSADTGGSDFGTSV